MLNGAKIGRNCLVGANALVTEGKEFPDNSLIVGSPARAVRTLDEQAAAGITASARGYVKRWRQFAAGLERIILNLKQRGTAVPGASSVQVFLAPLGEAARARAFGLANELRAKRVACVTALGQRSLKAQMRHANSLGARWAMILGEDELAAGEVTLRDLTRGEQARLAVSEAIRRVSQPEEQS